MTVDRVDRSTPALAKLQSQFSMSAVLRSAQELGVLDRLERGPADLEALVEDCGLAPRGAELLLGALAALELVEMEGRPHRARATAVLAGARELLRGWADLSSVLRGERRSASVETREGSEALYPRIVPALAALFEEAAESAAAFLAAPGQHVLDIGAGAAPWSIAVARRDRSIRVTAVDFPGVLPVTRRAVQDAGLEKAYEFLPGDAFSMDWGARAYDLVLVGNVCHLFAEEPNRRLLARVRNALRARGTIAIIDVLPDEQLERRAEVALYSLGLWLRTASGRAYPFSAYARWLDEVGFVSIARHELAASPPLSLVLAREAS